MQTSNFALQQIDKIIAIDKKAIPNVPEGDNSQR